MTTKKVVGCSRVAVPPFQIRFLSPSLMQINLNVIKPITAQQPPPLLSQQSLFLPFLRTDPHEISLSHARQIPPLDTPHSPLIACFRLFNLYR